MAYILQMTFPNSFSYNMMFAFWYVRMQALNDVSVLSGIFTLSVETNVFAFCMREIFCLQMCICSCASFYIHDRGTKTEISNQNFSKAYQFPKAGLHWDDVEAKSS